MKTSAMPTTQEVEEVLKQGLQAESVTVIDISGDCGTSFELAVVSAQFEVRSVGINISVGTRLLV